MKSMKEVVYEFIQQALYTQPECKEGVTTAYLAEALQMQRSNISALLNKLTQEGYLKKVETRPVLYRLAALDTNDDKHEQFAYLIGASGSLRNVVQLAKAAILYPKKSLNVLIEARPGCGSSYLSLAMYNYAVFRGVLHEQAPFIKVQCKHFSKDIEALDDELFGDSETYQESCFAKAHEGMLLIENFDLLNATQQSRVLEIMDAKSPFAHLIDCSDIFIVLTVSNASNLSVSSKVPMLLSLPEYKQRPLDECHQLIRHFFEIEARNSERTIQVEKEVIQALMLSEFDYHVKELELVIRAACANAYVRVVDDGQAEICVNLHDFKSFVRKNLIKVKLHSLELQSILGEQDVFYFGGGYSPALNEDSRTAGMYLDIKKQYDELSTRGINASSIQHVMDNHIRNLFMKYRYHNRIDDFNNLEQISKIVDERVTLLVKTWLESCREVLNREYKASTFFGLCLHINSLLTAIPTVSRLENQQLVSVIEAYPKEYAESIRFSLTLQSELGLQLPPEEIALIMMFLVDNDVEVKAKPVLLYVMHGSQTASSLSEVTNTLTQTNNVYSFDLNLEMEPKTALQALKLKVQSIDQGAGVIVIYDMGSIKTMMETIADETGVKIRLMNIPLTLIGIDIARKCAMESDVDTVYHLVNSDRRSYDLQADNRLNRIIVTLCHTGEGGAVQLKRYIDQYSKLNIKTIPLAISAREDLLQEVVSLRRSYKIHAFVGTYDPKLFGIPFISIGKIFEHTTQQLDRLLNFEPVNTTYHDYTEIYRYLEEQFKYVSIAKLKSVLPPIIDHLNSIYVLNEDQQIGLFMHIACLIERLMDGGSVIKNNEVAKIIHVFEEDYSEIAGVMKKIERSFKVIVDDNEIATIIMIIKKL